MKESQKRARMEIAIAGLSWLLSLGQVTGKTQGKTRKEIFVPLKGATPVQISEALKKPWQTELLDRLVKDDLLEQINSGAMIGYEVKDGYSVGRIVKNFEEDGSILANYLWPGSTVITEKTEEPDLESPELATVEIEETEESGDVVTNIKQVITLLKLLLEVLGANQKVIDDRLKRSTEAHTREAGAILEMASEIDKFKTVTSNYTEKMAAWITKSSAEQDKRLNGLNKRMEELEHRIADTHKLVEASHITMKTATTAVNKLTESAIDITGVSKFLEASNTRTTALQQAVDALVSRLNAAEEDKIAKLVKKLDSNASESAGLRDMLLEHLAERRTDGERESSAG